MSEPAASPEQSEAQLRRVPKYGVFLALGGMLGILVAALLTFAFDDGTATSAIGISYSRSQVFGFLLLFCVAGGIALGAIVALILDRTIGRRTKNVRIERETIRVEEGDSAS